MNAFSCGYEDLELDMANPYPIEGNDALRGEMAVDTHPWAGRTLEVQPQPRLPRCCILCATDQPGLRFLRVLVGATYPGPAPRVVGLVPRAISTSTRIRGRAGFIGRRTPVGNRD